MFGSDWFMLALLPESDKFLGQYRRIFEDHFSDKYERFLGGNALTFLGFDDTANANCQRTRATYERHGADIPSWLS